MLATFMEDKMNNARGLINLARNSGGGVGISLVTTLQARLAQMHQTNLAYHLTPRIRGTFRRFRG